MTFETGLQVKQIGVWLVVASAFAMLAVNLVILKVLPKLTMPVLILAWLAGMAGFVAVCVVEPTTINIALGVLFVGSIVYHGYRMMKRAARRNESESADATQ